VTDEQLATELREVVAAAREHLLLAVDDGNRTEAHRLLDWLIDSQHDLEDLEIRQKRVREVLARRYGKPY
jgi:hypothetical protein